MDKIACRPHQKIKVSKTANGKFSAVCEECNKMADGDTSEKAVNNLNLFTEKNSSLYNVHNLSMLSEENLEIEDI